MALQLLSSTRAPLYSSLIIINNNDNVRRQNLRLFKNTKLQFLSDLSISPRISRQYWFSPLNSSSVNGFSVDYNLECVDAQENIEFREKIRKLVEFIRSILPGGSWWSFSDEIEVKIFEKPVTVWRALTRMWELVAKDRWVIYAAFSTLIVAALSEISIPHFLTASIFTAQSGKIAVFHRNIQLMVLLCVTSGICRSKSCRVTGQSSLLFLVVS